MKKKKTLEDSSTQRAAAEADSTAKQQECRARKDQGSREVQIMLTPHHIKRACD